MIDIEKLVGEVGQPGVLPGCIAAAFVISRLAGRKEAEGSPWFGRAVSMDASDGAGAAVRIVAHGAERADGDA